MITNTTYRILVEKLGDSDSTKFIGNEGEVFYDPSNPALKLSDGSTVGGLSVVGEGGGGIQGVQGLQGLSNQGVQGVQGVQGLSNQGVQGLQGLSNQGVQGVQGTTATSTSYSQTLIVDPNGSDVTGTGGPNNPFQTLQAAHDYANANIPVADQVVVKLNCGSYAGNLLVTRPNIHFVGPNHGQVKSTRISGIVTVGTASSVGGSASDMISFENMLIVSNPSSSVVTIGGTIGCSIHMKDVYVFTSSTTAKCVDVTNTAPGGVKVELKNVTLQNQSSSGIALNLFNTYYANIDLLTIQGGTGSVMNIATTDAVVYNSRFESSGVSTSINATSSFTAGKPSLVLGNGTITNTTANATGINIASGAITNIAQVAFNVGNSAGTGFAVKGVAGSVFVNGNNLIVPGTNSKVSSAIGAGNIPLGTSLTPA